MISFANDYLEGAHEKVLTRLIETNLVQEPGYGFDSFSAQANDKIRDIIDCPEATIHYLVGGTQANQVVIDTMLESYEGVISADTGHVATHEAGAIEYSGHKVLTISSTNGKIVANDVDSYITDFYADTSHTHMVFPGMVYISYPTEFGTLYSKEELENLSDVCTKYDIPLFIDGARLGYGLASKEADLTIEDIARLSDVFYIGGTKIGALFGEAVVFTKNNEPKHFNTQTKQHGAMLAKGHVLGVQFLELFTDNLYFDISRHAVKLAMKLKQGFLDKDYTLYIDSPTNQQFFIMEDKEIKKLKEKVDFTISKKLDDSHHAVRFVTSWATTDENVDKLLELI